VLFFTKYTRTASKILRDQDTRSKQGDASMIDNLHLVKQLGYQSKVALESGDLRAFRRDRTFIGSTRRSGPRDEQQVASTNTTNWQGATEHWAAS